METEQLLFEKKNNLGTLVLNRPEKGNSLTPQMLEGMAKILTDLAIDDSVRTVIIRGQGEKAFCSGYDISALPVKADTDTLAELGVVNPLEKALRSIEAYPYPVVAMVNGYAFGAGCELAVACDLRIGAGDIKMGMPPAKIGIVYSAAGLQRFIQTIGLSRTKEMFFTGNPFAGSRLLDVGIVDYLVPRSELISFTHNFADGISGNAPLSLKGTKKIIGLLMKEGRPGKAELQIAESLAAEAFQSDDLKEGQTAFLEKRKPVFTGR